MQGTERATERLRDALDQLAIGDVTELLAEARADARRRVRSLVTDALVDSMLERAGELLSDQPTIEAPARSLGSDPAWYVYGVIRARDAALAAELSGQERRSVITVKEGDVAAVIGRVAADDFEESRLRAHLADMAWVETVARDHEEVLDQLCARTTVIPMRMCTVYRTEDAAREMLGGEEPALLDALDHLEGKREWGVQGFFSRARARQPEGLGPDGTGGGSAGASYMQRKREERELDEQLAESVERAVNEIHECLDAVTLESSLNPPQRSDASGRSAEMCLNGVYLVAIDEQDLFEEEVRLLQARFSATGLELTITGPWPPYNFLPGSIGTTW